MKIKVCGITSVEQMQALQELDVEYAGLIFYPPSARYAGEKLETQNEEIKNIGIKKVGVFVNADLDEVKRRIQKFDLWAVQLHGDESPEFCNSLMLHSKVIKVFRVGEAEDLKDFIRTYQHACDYYLFDTDTKMYGGSGRSFDWSILEQVKVDKPFFLSGGIRPNDVQKIKVFQNPFVEVVDINSRFERAPGVKNMELVAQFVNALNAEPWKR